MEISSRCSSVIGSASRGLLSEEVLATSLACILYHRAHVCHSFGLSCVDAPLLSSTMAIVHLNADRVFVKKLWRRIDEVLRRYGDEFALFEHDDVKLRLKLKVNTNKVYLIKGLDFVVGERDCEKRRDCVVVSRTKNLYARADFRIGSHFALELNTLYLFKLLLDLGQSRIVDEVMRLTLDTISYYARPSGEVDVASIKEELNNLARSLTSSKSLLLQSLSLSVGNLLYYVVPIRRLLYGKSESLLRS